MTRLRECPLCSPTGWVQIPYYREDVDSWETIGLICPVCRGKRWLSDVEWMARFLLLMPNVKFPEPETPDEDGGEA